MMDLSAIDRAGYYPFDEKSENQPFPNGVGSCEGFRIPGLIRLRNGGLFATTDARWTDPNSDYGGIDTMYAVSDDNGKTWRHGYAAYFPDSLGTPSDPNATTTCIDACPVQTTDAVIHIFVNLGPSGVTPGLCDPNPGTGFVTVDGKRRLALTDRYAEADNSPDGFGYYVGDAYGGFAPIIKKDAGETGYLIDEFFNIYKKTSNDPAPLYQPQVDTGKPIVQNVFYKDSDFHVFNTMHVLHVYTDNAENGWRWELVTDKIKLATERAAIVSPGNGIVTKTGAAVLPIYSSAGVSQAFLAISTDDCRSFVRSPYVPITDDVAWSGEAKPVELPNGQIRLFFRSGTRRVCYADFDPMRNAWGKPVIMPVLVHSECNFGAMINENHIYLSHIRGRGDDAHNRARGRIYDFLLDENNDMILRDVFMVTESFFSYSVIIPFGRDKAAVLYDTCEHGIVRLETIAIPEE